MPSSQLPRFAWGVLIYNLGVILWGAYVRASGSGAGCGSHWPLCNGEILPRAPSVATLIEYSHRLTSGLALIAVVVLLVWTLRTRPPGHRARAGAVLAVCLMLTEAAVGAGLVLFNLVTDNASMARALFMAAHLINTFLLVGAITLTAWWLSGGPALSIGAQPGRAAAWAAAAFMVLLAGTSGAVAALGDTLYPAGSLAEGLRADLSAASHVIIRLRLLHPLIAVTSGALLMAMASRLPREDDARGHQLARAVVIVVGMQLLAGLVNVLLLAPVWMQMVHLLLADLVWIAFVLLGAQTLAAPDPQVANARGRLPEPVPGPRYEPLSRTGQS